MNAQKNHADFKVCTSCEHAWHERTEFLEDPAVELIGYQANFGELNAGLFLFNHDLPECRTSLAIEAGAFTDMHEGPIFKQRMTGTAKCPGFCLHENSLDPCINKCECAYVRDVLQKVRYWPKRERS